jgi:Zn-dependent metalloprotease
MNMRRPAFAALCAAYALIIGSLSLLNLASAADSEPGPPALRKASDVALGVDAETLERQYRALSSMPSVTVVYSTLGPVRSVEGATGIVLSSSTRNLDAGKPAPEVLQKFKDVLLAAGTETLKVRVNRLNAVRRTIRMEQFIDGIPVLHGSVSVGVEDATGVVTVLGATFLPDRELPRQPKISGTEAASLAAELLVKSGMAKPSSVETSTPSLAYTGTHPDSTRGHLVWAVPATYTPVVAGAGDGIFLIDAITGEWVGQDALSKEAALSVYTANNVKRDPLGFPGNLALLFNHPGSSSDQIAMNAYNNLLSSENADQVIGGWLQTSALGLVMHYDTGYMNARYSRNNSVDFIRFGDGDPAFSMGPLGNSRDVVAHELGHVIARELFNPFGGDPSDAQSAAIDEAFGDVNAAMVDTFMRGGVPNIPATWTIGEVYTNSATAGIRSMASPKSMAFSARDWFPARDLGSGDDTRHVNATIMDHAFKLMANPPSGGFHVRAGQPILDSNVPGNIPSLFVPGLGPAKTWNIFWHTFDNPTINDFVTLPQVKAVAKSEATTLYGAVDADAVDRAFRAVGVGVGCTAAPQPPAVGR